MQPIGSFQRRNGEHVLVHRCLGCGFERFNRIAADDDFELVSSLPVLPPRANSGKQVPTWEEDIEELYEAGYVQSEHLT
jgi:PII-like signaling protein